MSGWGIVASKVTGWSIYYEGSNESVYRFNLSREVSGLEMILYINAIDDPRSFNDDWMEFKLVGEPFEIATVHGNYIVEPIIGLTKVGYNNDNEKSVGGLHVIYYALPKKNFVSYINITLHALYSNPRLDISRSYIREWDFVENVIQQSVWATGWYQYNVTQDYIGRVSLVSFGASFGDRPSESGLVWYFSRMISPPKLLWNPDVYVEVGYAGGINIVPESFIGTGNYTCKINAGIGIGNELNEAVSSGFSKTVYKVRKGNYPTLVTDNMASGEIDILLEILEETAKSPAGKALFKLLDYAFFVLDLVDIISSLGFDETVSHCKILVFKNVHIDPRKEFYAWFSFYSQIKSVGLSGEIVNFWGKFPFGSSIFDQYNLVSVTDLPNGGMQIGGILFDYHNPDLREKGYITIRSDGTVDPFTAPFTTLDYINYELHDNLNVGIEIRKGNIVLDGKNHTINGRSPIIGSHAVRMINVNNVIIKSLRIENFAIGIYLDSTSNSTIFANQIINTHEGVYLVWSFGNNISNNHIKATGIGIHLRDSAQNMISENKLINCATAISMEKLSYNNSVLKNNIVNCSTGVDVTFPSHNNYVTENNIINCSEQGLSIGGGKNKITKNIIVGGASFGSPIGIYLRRYSYSNNVSRNHVLYFSYAVCLEGTSNNRISINNIMFNVNGFYFKDDAQVSENNTIFENNMMNNTYNFFFGSSVLNILVYHNNFIDGDARKIYFVSGISISWDNGYPSGGNYWGKYNGKDEKSGVNQNIAGSDGISDTPYIIDEQNMDRYPLMEPYGELLSITYNYKLPKNASIQLTSNSIVLNFTHDLVNQKISFNVYWRNGTQGFVNINIPKTIFNSNPEVLLDGKLIPFNKSENIDYINIYFTYKHSKHDITIYFQQKTSTSAKNWENYIYIIVIGAAILALALLILKKKNKPKR
ncbi:MAG: right-handed parallel beta-helix repeat-containing protein [Thermoprotei archaeon]